MATLTMNKISPSGDPFFADPRNVEAVKKDIAEAHRSGAKFTRLESKEDVMELINSLQSMAYVVILSETAKTELAVIKKSDDRSTIKKSY